MTLFKQISKNIFLYPVIGQNINVMYDREKRRIIISEANSGMPLCIICTEEELTAEDFRFIATDVHHDFIDFSTGTDMGRFSIENLSDIEIKYKVQPMPNFILN